MNQHLKQAIAAAHAGKKPQAKVLLARVIKDEPENVNAWFLLSSLADTEDQKIQHLQKVLELQPNHPVATEQLAELVPMSAEPVEEALSDPLSDTQVYPPLVVSEPADEPPPQPEVDIPAVDVPEDPDEAMAWLERLAANQGAALDELPSLSQETAEPELEPVDFDYVEPEAVPTSDVPEEPDEAMAWLEQLAADQDTSLDEFPAMFDSESEETAGMVSESEDDYSWLEDDDFEETEGLPTLINEQVPEEEEAAKTLTISNDFDFVSQSKGDSIPAWLAGEEGYIAADTVITESPVEEDISEPEPENLPDWLNDESLEDWMGDEGRKSGQVVWKPGEGDDSMKPTAPGAKKAKETKTKTAAKRTAAGSSNNRYLVLLIFAAFVLIVAIFFILITQPF